MLHIAGRRIAGLAFTFSLLACSEDPTSPGNEFAFSFNSGLDGWSADATDIDNPPVVWSIQQSTAEKKSGAGSARFFLNNLNDAGKIWLVRSFTLEPNTNYNVAISYAFATSDYGDFNHWQLITGVHSTPPNSAGDLVFQGETANGQSTNVGYRWLDKQFSLSGRTDAQGRLWLAIGVWGTWETPRTYYIDDVAVTFQRVS